ncbi:vomeronasal type-2 receptor 26-like [Spea bombifrons]|uniref:vomeronasal type-2 receptor 26-like n=1 Tax=Spea bombifrons TaxID=233779 RepID=UPI0023496780|nr:vomeronasal type-2 receptor 26-like [Spea bombifrons]
MCFFFFKYFSFRPSYQYLRHLLVFIYAIEEINTNNEVLPNITLGFQIYDACSSQVMALMSTFNILSEQEEPAPNFICDRKPKTVAMIGHLLSSVTNTIAEVSQLYNYPQLNYYLKNVHLKPESGEDFFFDENGNPPEIFDILNWNIYNNGTIIKTRIGSFKSSTTNLVINGSQIKWESHFKETPSSTCSETCSSGNRKAQHLGRPSCCFDCVPCSEGEITNSANMETCLKCPDDQWSNPERNLCILKAIDFLSYGEPLGATLSASASILFLLTAAVFFVFVKLRNTAIVRANNRNLSYILLISLMFSFLCSFLFLGRPTMGTCLVRQAAFGLNFSVAISSILGKTIAVVIAFNATKPNSMFRKCLKCKISIWLVPLCSLGELIICIIWLLYSPPFVDFDTTTIPGTIVMHCNEGSIVAFYTVVAYIGALAFFSFLLAFMVRKLPDTFNEAQFITFSMLVFCSVWVTFIPAYLSSKGKHVVAVEIFTILASTAGLLFFIFAPKCYIVVLKPERNTTSWPNQGHHSFSKLKFY